MSTDTCRSPEDATREEDDLVDRRKARIREYLAESLRNPNPLRANLGAEASNLMRMGLRLQEAIDDSLAEATNVLKQVERLSPAMDAYLRVTRQWDRLVQVDRRIATEEAPRGTLSPTPGGGSEDTAI